MARFRSAPKTEEVYRLLKEDIESGKYAACGVLPQEPVLSEQLGVSRKTLRSALARLEMESIVERIRGKGTFISCKETDKKILVIVGDMEDITNPGRYILPGIQQEAAAAGFTVETCTAYSLDLTPPEDLAALIKRRNYCGILSFTANYRGTEPSIEALKKTGLPVLLVHAHEKDTAVTGFAVMGTNYRQAIRDGLLYLARQGHKRVSYLAFKNQRISQEGYFELLKEAELDDSPALRKEITSPNDEKIIMQEIASFFDTLPQKPTAVFCFSDFFAVCLYKYLKQKNIRIPEDIAVLSIGGLIGCDFLLPPLSSIDFDCLEIGRQAVRTLLEMRMKNITYLPFMSTPHHLSERESTQIRK